jgi:hypothetical protein
MWEILTGGKYREERKIPTYPGGEGKLQVVRAECVIGDGGVEAFRQHVLVAVDVLGDPEPEPEELYTNSQKVSDDAPHPSRKRREQNQMKREA